MSASPYRFPTAQEAFLRANRQMPVRAGHDVPAVSLLDIDGRRMPDAGQQDLQGTCVAHAVVGLVEFYHDFRSRLSVQFLFSATKQVERMGMERNLARLRTGEPLDAAFEAVYHSQLLQLRMLADVNGGLGSDAMRGSLAAFENAVRAQFASMPGCLVVSAFHVVETQGICRYALWPSAAAQATSVFGDGVEDISFPPGTCEDARKRCVTHGLYLLGTPNNVDEICGILSGANGRRAMPVVVTVDFFVGCDNATYAFPATAEAADGHLVSVPAWQGRHAVLLVGYRDDGSFPGGGYFIFRNSLGTDWGDRGYGKMPYAYLACFAREAGTILQDRIDYEGDGYNHRQVMAPARHRSGFWALNLLIAAGLVGVTWWLVAWRSPSPTAGDLLAAEPAVPTNSSAGAAKSQDPVVYKVFLSCADGAERKALRTALASEGVQYPVEFLPQTLDTVLAVRVTMPEGNAYAVVAEILGRYYEGPRRDFWTDSAALTRMRAIYITRANLRQWDAEL